MGARDSGDRYDVFVSYASADRAFAKELDLSLREQHGLRTFIDSSDLRPGMRWIDALEEAIDHSFAVAILLGPQGLGNVQHYEWGLALHRQIRERDFPIIPVLLPGSEAPPTGFLALLTWVDLRQGLGGQESLTNLIAAVRRQSTRPATIREAVCPYIGLEPFREEDAAFFCGRDQVVAELVSRVKDHTLVAVVGPSGSGKSSLVFAGLLPELRREQDDVIWDVLSLHPGPWPLHCLAAAFDDEPLPTAAVLRDARLETAAAHLREGADDVLVRIAAKRLAAAPGDPDQLLLYIDQWEELYSARPGDDKAKDQHARDVDRFVALVLSLAADKRARTRVVLTVRADFYSSLMTHPALSALVPRQQVNIGPMSRDDLRAAIVTPAQKVGLSFDPPLLVDQILNDAGTDEAVLPLLQYALKETWRRRREGRQLTAVGYMEAGGVSRAIQTTADRTYSALDEHEKGLARRLFLALVTPGEGREDTRARITIPSDPAVQEVIAKFADRKARLLVTGLERGHPGGPAADGSSPQFACPDAAVRGTVEVAHEALIRTWPVLRGWLDNNRELLRSRTAIVQQRREWETHGRRQDLLLSAGFQLERGRALLACSGDVPVEDIRDYIKLSAKVEDDRTAAKRDAELAARRKLTVLAFGAVVVAVVFGGLAVSVHGLLRRTRDEAARNLARSAIIASRDGALERETVANALRAAALSTVVLREPAFAEAGFAALAAAPLVGRLHGHSGGVHTATFSSDGTRLVTASDDHTARLWDANTGQLLNTLQGHSGPVHTAAFSPDGTRLVTADTAPYEFTARLWDANTGQLLNTLHHSGWVNSAAFSQDGTRVVTASGDGSARLWNAKSGQLLNTLKHSRWVNAAAFSPDGTRVVTASSDGSARLWDAKTGQPLATLKDDSCVGPVGTAVFSPDGMRVVTASGVVPQSDDPTSRLWDAKTGQLLTKLQGHSGRVNTVAFSPDGSLVVTSSNDFTARLWDARTGQLLNSLQGHSGWVSTAAFSPDGARVVTTSGDHTARLWDTKTGQLLETLQGHSGPVLTAAFSPDGTRVVTASSDKTARLWDAKSGQLPNTLLSHSGWVTTAAFSPDGTRVVTASGDRTARLWGAKTGQLLATLQGHSGPVGTAAFSPDGTLIVTASGVEIPSIDHTARLWDARTGQLLNTLQGHSGPVSTATFSTDGAHVVTSSVDHTARLWNAKSGQLLNTLQGHSGPVYAAAFSPDSTRVVTASADLTARLWNAKSGQLLNTLNHRGWVNAAVFSPDGAHVVTASTMLNGSNDGIAYLWDAKTGQLLATLQGHSGRVNTVAFSSDSTRMVTASGDHTARLWNAKTGQLLATLQGHSDWVSTAAFSPDGTRVVTASIDKTARLWDAMTGQLLTTLQGHSDYVSTARFSPDGTHVVTASRDKTARLWPAEYKSCLSGICAIIKDSIRYMGSDYNDLKAICALPSAL